MMDTATNVGRTANYSLNVKEEIASLLNKILLKRVLESGALKDNFGADDQGVLESAILRLIKENPDILRMVNDGAYNPGYASVKRQGSVSPANQKTNLLGTGKIYQNREEGLIHALQYPNRPVSNGQDTIMFSTPIKRLSRIAPSVKGYRGISLELNPRGRNFAPRASHLPLYNKKDGEYN